MDIRERAGDAPIVVARHGQRPAELLAAVGLAPERPRPVLVVCGGAEDLKEPERSRARDVLGDAVARAARATGAAVVDGGTDAGVMAIMGEVRASSGLPVLLGVAPAAQVAAPGGGADGRVELDSHHSHFVLADGDDWGDETQLLMGLAEALAGDGPVVTVLAGGGRVARAEVVEAVARGWPVFVVEGTGGAAEQLTTYLGAPDRAIEDPALGRAAAGGDVRALPADARQAARALVWELVDDDSLKTAWKLFATYDGLATRLRRQYERFQASILLLGILGTLMALLHEALGGAVLHWLVVVAPILGSALIAIANRRAAGKRWVLLRAAAESVKSEIYRYRTRTGLYADTTLELAALRRRLAEQLSSIDDRLLQTDVGSAWLRPYDGPLPPPMYGAAAGDDGLSPLDGETYVAIRLNDQLAYYRGKTRVLDRRRTALNGLTVAAGGAGTILAAAGFEIWIGLTTAITGAALAQLGYLQIENTIVAYNQSAGSLAALEREYRARLGGPEPLPLHELVTRGEGVLTTEVTGWVQQMTDAMREQQRQQAEAEEAAGHGRDGAASARTNSRT